MHPLVSGTFKVQDFKLNTKGLTIVDEGSDSPGESAGVARAIGGIDIASMAEIETLNELGSGASGTVFRARHRTTGAIFAVKQVTVLEKPKREQVVSELRIMRKHQCPWLVALYNAFYEEAKVRVHSCMRTCACPLLAVARLTSRAFSYHNDVHHSQRCILRWNSWMPARSPILLRNIA